MQNLECEAECREDSSGKRDSACVYGAQHTSITSPITTFTCRNESEIGSRCRVGLLNHLLSVYLCELTC